MFKTNFLIVFVISLFFSQFALSEQVKNSQKQTDQKKRAPLADEQKATQLLNQKTVYVTDKQLEDLINKLSPTERDAITKIQKEIANWPKSVFDEISNYREFVITARKIATEKYHSLSPEALQALETEKALKASLSPETVNFLETIHLRAVNKTN